MSFKGVLWLILFLFSSILLKGQIPDSINWVPNPSFEDTYKRKVNMNFLKTGVVHWMTGNNGATDYFHRNNLSMTNRVPNNLYGQQEAHSGNAYAGICIKEGRFGKNIKSYMEYLHVQIYRPMKAGQEYCVSLFISRADNHDYWVKDFGIHFSKEVLHIPGKNRVINYQPQLKFHADEGFKDAKEWTQLCGIFKSEGNEQWILFGSFNRFQYINAHYFVDDFAIVPVNSFWDCACQSFPEAGDSVVLKDVHFDFDQANIKRSSYRELDKLYGFLSRNENIQVEFCGHTDDLGTEAHNIWLSEQRAQNVAVYMIDKGISESRIKWNGRAYEFPLSIERTRSARKLNRRVEMIILK